MHVLEDNHAIMTVSVPSTNKSIISYVKLIVPLFLTELFSDYHLLM